MLFYSLTCFIVCVWFVRFDVVACGVNCLQLVFACEFGVCFGMVGFFGVCRIGFSGFVYYVCELLHLRWA